jgi:hypothetical protein
VRFLFSETKEDRMFWGDGEGIDFLNDRLRAAFRGEPDPLDVPARPPVERPYERDLYVAVWASKHADPSRVVSALTEADAALGGRFAALVRVWNGQEIEPCASLGALLELAVGSRLPDT